MDRPPKKNEFHLMEDREEIKNFHITVTGNVQAVGFRYFTWQTANVYRIYGWVRNRDDGSVEIEAQGENPDMRQFIKTIKKGSPFSHVERVIVTEHPPSKNYSAFTIVN